MAVQGVILTRLHLAEVLLASTCCHAAILLDFELNRVGLSLTGALPVDGGGYELIPGSDYRFN